MNRSIDHPSFKRQSATVYLMDLDANTRVSIHVGQIARFLMFDRNLRRDEFQKSPDIPLGYAEFAAAFNNGAVPGDHRRLSTISDTRVNYRPQIQKSTDPVSITDFFISAEQTGMHPRRRNEDQFSVIEEYAKSMARQSKRRDKAIQDRLDRKESFFSGISNPKALTFKRTKKNRTPSFHPDNDDGNIYFDTEDSTTSFFNEGSSHGFSNSASHTERTSSPADLSVHAAYLSSAPPVNLFEAFEDLPTLPEDVDLTNHIEKTIPQEETSTGVQTPQEEMQE